MAHEYISTLQNAAGAIGAGTPLNTSGNGVVALAISGTFVATITFEGQGPDGNWYAINARQRGGGAVSSTTTSGGLYEINCLGLSAVRANVTGYTSGSVTAKGQSLPLTPTSDTTQLTGSNVTLLSAVTATGAGTPKPVGSMKSYVFEAGGTATAFVFHIEVVGPLGVPRTINKVWDELNNVYLSGSDITVAGFYSVSVPPFTNIQANPTTITGGNLNVSGGLMQ